MSTDIAVRFDVIDRIIEVGNTYPKGHDFGLTCSHEELWVVITYCRENNVPIEYVAMVDDIHTMSTAGSHRLLAEHELER